MTLLRSLFLATAFLPAVFALATETAAPDQKDFEKLLGEIGADITALNVDRFFSHFENAPDFVYAFNAKVYTFAEAHDYHVKAWATLTSVAVEARLVSAVQPAPNFATVTALGRFDFVMKDGTKRASNFALTLSLIKRDGVWHALQVAESTQPTTVPAN